VIVAIASGSSQGSQQQASQGAASASAPLSSSAFQAAATFDQTLTPLEYLDAIFTNSDNPLARLYLPNYAYTQSLVYAKGDVGVYGQVRVLGGTAAGGQTRVGYGAMVTGVPEYVTSRAAPTQRRFHITEWKEI
jgi:hypothetical protein